MSAADTPTARAEAPAGERIDLPPGVSARLFEIADEIRAAGAGNYVATYYGAMHDAITAYAAARAPTPAAGGEPVEVTTARLTFDPGRAYALAELDPAVRAMDPAAPTPRAGPERKAIDWSEADLHRMPSAAPAAPGAGVDLAGVERTASGMPFAPAEVHDLAVGWTVTIGPDRQCFDLTNEAMARRLAKAVDDHAADAVRALVRPSGEIVGLLEDWRRAIIDNRKGIVEHKVVRAAEDAVHAAIAALGRDAAGRGGGAGVPEHLRRLSEAASPDWCVYGEPDVGLPPSLFSGVVSQPEFGPIEPLRGFDLALAAAAVNFVRARIAAEGRDRGADGREG